MPSNIPNVRVELIREDCETVVTETLYPRQGMKIVIYYRDKSDFSKPFVLDFTPSADLDMMLLQITQPDSILPSTRWIKRK